MRLLLLPGDAIGPEISAATERVLRAVDEAFGLDLEIEHADIGWAAHEAVGETMPQAVLDRVGEVDGTILGPVSHLDYPSRAEGGWNPSAAIRTTYRLYSNVRPARSIPDLTVLPEALDLVIVRENTEGFYSDRNMVAGSGEFMPDPDLALSVRKISRRACNAVAEEAFRLAAGRRQRVTAVHKANVLKLSDGLFLDEVRAVASRHPDIELRELIVDAATAHLVRSPQEFDVVVTTNMFGDILSDLACALSGSLGLGGSLNIGDEVAVAQAQHGSAPDIAGQGVANPTSLILSTTMLLRWWSQRTGAEQFARAADAVDAAVTARIADPSTRTRDLRGSLSTEQFTTALLTKLES
ncbi:isocitrate/isopropylmalate dehydrogenase family protein [Knoellia locipacati]|uniref:3-isopropylmalate dehydrogenase n=1 Tax=Knoellia locipacati TaxID=882824 RepID=A0A512SW60_9MICO|nr:isocitrate/isopropylmalate family dehydrogenase [Knoellia locipacati]GEQ12189.1 3-isopropylmalate dehydrogenase [Knoellia locipacati]